MSPTASERRFRFLLPLAVFGLVPLFFAESAETLHSRNAKVWKLRHGVSDAHWGDAAWLAQDSDGDGISNQAEMLAGTDPLNRAKGASVTSFTRGSGTVTLFFPTELGKRYRAESTPTLDGSSSWTLQSSEVAGNGLSQSLVVPSADRGFFRIRIDDLDSDGDGVSDWVEQVVSLNPLVAQTVTGSNDVEYLDSQLALPNEVTLSASTPFASEDGPVAGRFTIRRSQNLFPLSLDLRTTGSTAVPGADYLALPGSIVLPARGAYSTDVFVNPMVPQAAVKGGRSVRLTVAPPASGNWPFKLVGADNATVIINGTTVPSGTGLLGRYYDTASTLQADASNFGQAGTFTLNRVGASSPYSGSTIVVPFAYTGTPALQVGHQVKLSFTSGSLNSSTFNHLNYTVVAVNPGVSFTVAISGASVPVSYSGTCHFSIQSFPHPAFLERVDPTVNFDWSNGTPGGVVILPNNPADNYSAIWETYLQPSTPGNYVFQLDADTRARVLLDTGSGLNPIVEHNWNNPGADAVGTFKQSAPIALAVPAAPSQRYRMRVEYVELTGDARCRLQWNVNGGAFSNIPQANQFTHTQTCSYSFSNGSAVISPTGGHSLAVGSTVPLAFSSGVLFTPGAGSTYNGTYTVTAVNGTTSFTVGVTGFPVSVSGASTGAGSPFISVPSTAGLAVGMAVSGAGLPANEFITAIGSGFITVTTGTGVTAQTNTTLTAVLPSAGSSTGNGFVLNQSSSGVTGLLNYCYPNISLAGGPGRVGVDTAVTSANNGIWGSGTPDPARIQPDSFSVRWTGQVQPQFSEEYTFYVTADDGAALWINGKPQTFRLLNSSVIGGSTYTYDAATGDLVVNYSGLSVPAGNFALGEIVRLDPSTSSLGHASTASPTYDYDPTTGVLTVDYTNLVVGQPGGTRVAGSYAVGETVELDPTSGGLSFLAQLPYVIQSVSGNKFAVNVGAINFTPALSISSIAATNPCTVTTVQAHGLATGATVRIAGVSGGTFSSPINGVFAVTVLDARTFTVTSNCSAAPLAGAGLVTVLGNITVSDNRNLPIQSLQLAGTGTYNYSSTTGDAVIDYSALSVSGNAIQVGQKLALDPTSGNLTNLASAFYTVTAVTPTTFTVNFGAGAFLTGTGSITIITPPAVEVLSSITNAFTVNIGPGRYVHNSAGSINLETVGKPMKEWSQNNAERYVRIPMQGGVRYDIQLDTFEAAYTAKSLLTWSSPSQPKQVIPAERLYPSSLPSELQAKPAHVSATDTIALVNGSFTHALGVSNGAMATISGNPAWLTFNSATGVLSGTPPAGASGNYQIVVTLQNAAGTSTSLLNLRVEEEGGTVVREIWNGISGGMLSSVPTGINPSATASLTSLEAPTNSGDNYGARIRGYLTAPVSGNYYFWIAGNNSAELWISNDDEPVNAFKRAWVTAGTAAPRAWNSELSRKSPWLALEAGRKYYFEILHKAGASGDGTDNLAVGWSKPGESTQTPSEVVPGYVLSAYVPPAAGSTPGTLYVASMLSQSGALTNGVGGATLRISEDETTAYLKFNYSGLSGPITSQHVHSDPYQAKPSTILFDIDTPSTPGDGLISDPSNPNVGAYRWTITGVGALTRTDVLEILREGKAYINLHTALYPAGEIRGNFTLAQGTRFFVPPPPPILWTDDSGTHNGAARFLSQASFGANVADILALKALTPSGADLSAGIPANRYDAWIEDQFTKAATSHLTEVQARKLANVFSSTSPSLEFNAWWRAAVSGQDQLRQRVAYALSQIHVVSGQGPLENNGPALAHFYDTLANNAFGNFRDILIGTTLTPAMGRYLDMLGNDKPDPAVGRSANENYAREIKQLFSIGLYRLWPDGTLILNSKDAPIDTYGQREVVGLSQVFTGWYYGYDGPPLSSFSAPANWTRPMREVPARHFIGPKRVLNNEVLPGLDLGTGQTLDPFTAHSGAHFASAAYQALPSQELQAVHDLLFNHPNTGPFICRQLIQRLVTSHPSRDYLYRVVQKFNNNGAGVRGDMKSVLKAILLDYEARSSDLFNVPAYGKQREPVLRVAHAARAFRPSEVSGTYSQSGTNLLTINTGNANPKLASGNTVFLEFTDTSGDPSKPAPLAGVYTVATPSTAPPYTYTIAAPGWYVGTYSQSGNTVTVSIANHGLPGDNSTYGQVLPDANHGRAYFDFTSGGLDGWAGFDRTVQKVQTSNAYDTPSGSVITQGSTFTLTAPDSATRSGNVMIARFQGSYSSTGRNGIITIDTFSGFASAYGQQPAHGLSVGDAVFLNFTNSRDTTSFNETSTENDLVYTVLSVPDPNTFTVAARDAANAAIGADNQVQVFPFKPQTLVRSGSVNARQSTFALDGTDTDLDQTPLNPTTVFNFYLPDYKFAGPLASQGITTPEFQITSETAVIKQANFLYNGIFNPSNTNGISSFRSGSNALVLDFSPWMGAADIGLGAPVNATVPWTSNQNLSALVDQLATLLGAGQLSVSAKTVIKNFVGAPVASISLHATACTVTTASAHNLNTGDSVLISGVTDGTFGGIANSLNSTNTARVITKTGTHTFTIPLSCTVSPTTAGLANAHVSVVPYNQASPTDTHKRDRLRSIVHLILTSPDYTIQR